MRISATIICKNEAAHIEDCLGSLDEVDQIVLCDTGSTDDTIALAKRRRPDLVLVHHRWNDHFADARNAALAAADGDWCLIIDCDETIRPGTIPALRAAIADHPDVMTLRFLCQAKGDPSAKHYMVRAHARVPGIAWRGRIHESLTDDSLIVAPGCVLEYGYSTAHNADPDRALRLLLMDHAASPDDHRTLYYLSREYIYRLDYAAAIPLLERRVSSVGYRAECADAWLYLARCYWHTQQGDQARESCLRSLLLVPDCREALELMATMSWPAEASVWTRYAATAQNAGVLFVRSPAVASD